MAERSKNNIENHLDTPKSQIAIILKNGMICFYFKFSIYIIKFISRK
jgi:hypothetical protein